MLYVPAYMIWLPDIVLYVSLSKESWKFVCNFHFRFCGRYNNADGHYEITIMTKAAVHSNGLFWGSIKFSRGTIASIIGTVIWEPPAVYNSMCQIDVRWFPFDEVGKFILYLIVAKSISVQYQG